MILTNTKKEGNEITTEIFLWTKNFENNWVSKVHIYNQEMLIVYFCKFIPKNVINKLKHSEFSGIKKS
jgi:hypothetical protein